MKGRVWGSWALLVVTWLLLLASVMAVWTRSVLLNSDRFTATLAPVLRDERVIEAVSERVSAGVISALGVEERLQEMFPGRAGALAAAQITISAQEAVRAADGAPDAAGSVCRTSCSRRCARRTGGSWTSCGGARTWPPSPTGR